MECALECMLVHILHCHTCMHLYTLKHNIHIFFSGCGGELADTQGEIMSPNHPQPYPHHQFCRWTIRVQPGHALKINITNLDIRPNSRCDADYLKTQHGRFSHKGRLCGRYTTIAYYLRDILATEFTFRSTDTSGYGGFRLTFSQVPIGSVAYEVLNRVHIDNRTTHYSTNKWTWDVYKQKTNLQHVLLYR